MTPETLAPLAFEFRRYLERPSCPRCGEALVAAEWSALIACGHIQHAWSCHCCGNNFESAVRLSTEDNRSPE